MILLQGNTKNIDICLRGIIILLLSFDRYHIDRSWGACKVVRDQHTGEYIYKFAIVWIVLFTLNVCCSTFFSKYKFNTSLHNFVGIVL